MDSALSLFYVGAYAKALAALQPLANDPVAQVFAARSLLAMGQYPAVLSICQQRNPQEPVFQLLRLFSNYRSTTSTGEAGGASAAAELQKHLEAQRMANSSRSGSPTQHHQQHQHYHQQQLHALWTVVAAEWLLEHGQLVEEAMRLVAPLSSTHMECGALWIQLLLQSHRVDLAASHLSVLKNLDEESVVYQWSEALVFLCQGGSHYQDAFYIYQELLETYGSTTKLLTNQAACELLMGKLPEAERLLQDAVKESPNDVDALYNLLVCSKFQDRQPDAIARFQQQLLSLGKRHALIKDLDLKASLFDRCAQKFHS